MFLSIVIPSFNEGRRLPKLLENLRKYLLEHPEHLGAQIEILIIEDGSRPEDQHRVADAIEDTLRILFQNSSNPQIKITQHALSHNQGKGAALEFGFQKATGDWIGFMDADGSTQMSSLGDLLLYLKTNPNFDAILGARILMLGKLIKRKSSRHYVGRIFATLFYWLFKIPSYDTQCGFKFFRRSKVLPLLTQIQDKGWVWDTQLIVLSFYAGLKMREFTVDWAEEAGSKVSLLRDPMRMFYALLKFRSTIRKKQESTFFS